MPPAFSFDKQVQKGILFADVQGVSYMKKCALLCVLLLAGGGCDIEVRRSQTPPDTSRKVSSVQNPDAFVPAPRPPYEGKYCKNTSWMDSKTGLIHSQTCW